MDAFVEHLKSLCKEHPTRSKWVIVPGHNVGRTIGDRLVLEGTDWANLRFVTPLDLALRMGAPYLVEQGIDPSEDQLGAALLMRLLLGLPERHTYFRPLAHEPRMAMALWSTIRELREAGIRATDLHAEHFESAAKHAELQALLDAYERHLADHKLGDQATVYEEALKHQEWCPIKAEDCWTVLPGARWTPLQEQLLTSLKGDRMDPGTLVCSTEQPDFSPADARWAEARRLRKHSFFVAGGPESEVEEVMRRILTSGRKLDEVEIACASDGYSTLLWEKACRYEWPVTLATGLPATLTRPGRALLGLIEWVEDNFAAGKLRRLLQSGDVTAPPKAARLLVKAQAAWGRATYRLSLTHLATSSRARAKDDISDDEREYRERNAKEAEALAEWIDALISSIPEPGADNHVDLEPLVQAAVTFVEDTTARASALDHAAANRLVTSLSELRALGDFRCPLGQSLRFIRERVESLHIGADRPRPGYLHISQLRDAGWPNRPLLFVVGLEEGRVFPAAVEDPVLLDKERAAIETTWRPELQLRLDHAEPKGSASILSSGSAAIPPPILPVSAERLNDLVAQTLTSLDTAMSTHGTEVHLSYSCRDLRQFRATYASWVMLHAFRLAKGDETLTYQDLHKETGAPVSTVPAAGDQALGRGRWWLHAAAKAGEHAGKAAVFAEFAPLAQGVRAEEARDSAQFTEYDGYVPEAGPVLDPAQDGRVVSPTQLEKAAGCPFRHFLERVLGVYAIESGDREQDLWLNPLIRGSLLHDLYAEFHTRCLDESRSPAEADHQWLQEHGRQLLDETAVAMPPPSAEVAERESRDFLEDLALFSRAEIENPDKRTPVVFEKAFTNHVVKAGDLTFRISGRIDRIDQLADGTFEILDYKTGGYWENDWLGTFAGGRRLQHALYGLAAVDILKVAKYKKPQVAGATYYFSSAKGQQHQKHLSAQSKSTVIKVLGDLRDVIAQGLFVHTPDSKRDCGFCHHGPACGREPAERAKAKQGDPLLEPYRRLASHD
jgi:ATP-dependent helicase/nuclease subunit B